MKTVTEKMLEEVQNTFDTTRRELELIQFAEKEFKKVYHYNVTVSEKFLDMAEKEHKKIDDKFESGKIDKEEFSKRIKDLHYAVNEIHNIIIVLVTSMTTFSKMHTEETDIDSLPSRYEFIKRGLAKTEKQTPTDNAVAK